MANPEYISEELMKRVSNLLRKYNIKDCPILNSPLFYNPQLDKINELYKNFPENVRKKFSGYEIFEVLIDINEKQKVLNFKLNNEKILKADKNEDSTIRIEFNQKVMDSILESEDVERAFIQALNDGRIKYSALNLKLGIKIFGLKLTTKFFSLLSKSVTTTSEIHWWHARHSVARVTPS